MVQRRIVPHAASGGAPADLLHVPLCEEEMADLLGLSAAQVERSLADLETRGIIQHAADGALLLNPHRLSELPPSGSSERICEIVHRDAPPQRVPLAPDPGEENEGPAPCVDERVVVLGLGNTLMSDDGFGLRVAERLRTLLAGEAVAVRGLCWGGFSILDELAGVDWAVLIDVIQTGQAAPGTLTHWAVPRACPSVRLLSYHDMGFFTALEFGRLLGLAMPRRVSLFTVEALDTLTVAERLTPPVARAVEPTVTAVLETLWRGGALRASRAPALVAGAHI